MFALIGASFLACISCGSKSKATKTTSGLTFRAFVSDPLHLTSAGVSPSLAIVDATKDLLSTFTIGLLGSSQSPGLMAVSPDKSLTAIFSSQGNTVAVVNNARETLSQAGSATATSSAITVPGPTESMFIGSDNSTAFAAIPSAPVSGQPPGAVVVLSLTGGFIKATLPIPGARYLVQSHSGDRILVFGDNSDVVTLIYTGLVGTSASPLAFISGFHRPVWAVFDGSDSTAYVLNCGPECGDANPASITPLDAGSGTPGIALPLTSGGVNSGATTGLLSGNTLYVAGSPPGTTCSSGSATVGCGTLTLVDLSGMTVMNSSPIFISDGYHNRVEMAANGQIFIGAHACTNISASIGGTARGCLSIFNTQTAGVVVPPDNGDVTGIAPNPQHPVVYVCEGGVLRIYDAASGQLQKTQINIVGQPTDVKIVDTPHF